MEWLSLVLISVLSISMIVSFILIANMYQKYKQTRISAVFVLLLFFVFDQLARIGELVALVNNPDDLIMLYLDLNQPFPILFSVSGILAAGVYLFFIDYYVSERLPRTHIAVFVSILSSFITFNYVKLHNLALGVEFDGPSIENTPISFDFLPAVMITYLLIIGYPKLFRLAKQSEYEKKTRALNGLMISMIFLFVSPSIFITLANQLEVTEIGGIILGTLIPRITLLIGNTILLLTYGRTSAAYLHSQRLEKLLVITKIGTPIYSLDFIEEPTKRDDVLISGSLTALSGLLAESIEVTDLESIEFKEKDVLISHKQTMGFFLITDRPSQFAKNALETAALALISEVNFPEDATRMNEMILDAKIDQRMRVIFGIE